jgi:hypothetical protein
MPKPTPPSDELLHRAAELRAAGATWETVAREVKRSVRAVYYWPRRYAERWTDALTRAERLMTAQADCESVRTLRGLLVSKDETVRWHAAKILIARRIDRDKIELKNPQSTQRPLGSEAAQLIAFLDGHSDEELSEISAALAPHLETPAA